jgi:branched-chain amino acid transport system ATP-binding protein
MILQVEGVTKQFGGLLAVNNVTFDLPEGQILGLIGPNGAGKTTLFNVINGVYLPEQGRILFLGADTTGSKTYAMAHKGLARTHQIVKPLNDLTVHENVMVGGCFGGAGHSLSEAAEISEEVLEFVGLDDRAEQLAGSLNVAQKKRLELARALAARPKLLLLDEVLAGLNPTEIAQMVETVRRIRDQGVTIIMIEHVMHAVMNVSERILVLDYGELIAEGTPEEVSNDERVIEAYLGDPKLAQRFMEQAQ